MTKETLLHAKHVKLGAKMVDFAGWHMPVQKVGRDTYPALILYYQFLKFAG